MTADWFMSLLRPDVTLRRVDGDIWSTLTAGSPGQPYDGRAAIYDRLIGNRLYNLLAWGCSPDDYAGFARTATAAGSGVLLDIGCGSLVSTAPVDAQSRRPTVLADVSLGMLAAARRRLVALVGAVPPHLVLVQADALALPFRDGGFGAVLCPGLLHLIEDCDALAGELVRVAPREAPIFLSSLTACGAVGRHYLDVLHRAGEVARPRTPAELAARIRVTAAKLHRPVAIDQRGSMAFVEVGPSRQPIVSRS